MLRRAEVQRTLVFVEKGCIKVIRCSRTVTYSQLMVSVRCTFGTSLLSIPTNITVRCISARHE